MSLPLKTVKVVWQVRTPFKVVSSESKNVHNVVHRCSLVSLYEITTMISSFECFCYCKPFLHTVIGVYVLQWKCLGNSFSCLDFPVSVPFWQTWFACRRLWRRSTAGHKGWNEKQEWQPGRGLNSLLEVGCSVPEGFKRWGLQALIWVSFPRTGILAKMCHFFEKSRAFVWLSLIIVFLFFNCSCPSVTPGP